jgi:hypothetical protein
VVLRLQGEAPKKKAKFDVSSNHHPINGDDSKDVDYRLEQSGHRRRSKRTKSPTPPPSDDDDYDNDDDERLRVMM